MCGLFPLPTFAADEPVMSDHDRQPTWQLHCPASIKPNAERITLAHGEGGRLTRKLIRERIIASLDNDILRSMDDAACLPNIGGRLAMTTDSFVVSPLFFPGGDIGSLAVFGTVNDLAVSGARPLYLTLSFILEEGLPLALLDRVLASVAEAASKSNVRIVAGDTKVVPRGAADGLFINTTGIGQLIEPVAPGPGSLREGDELIVTGPIGRHGIAVLCAREELALEPPPRSDSAPLVDACEVLRKRLGSRLRAMRDATRGGVAAVLHEWAEASNLTLTINDDALPVSPAVHGACELLGLDPLHVANEGTMVVAVETKSSQAALLALQSLPDTTNAVQIGTVRARQIAAVTIRRTLGVEQPLDDPLGAPLPRIC
jgi:hydrogenase expression/formation protein HypE